MKITDVKAMTLKGYKQWNYVQIETNAGLTGIGEAHPGAGVAEIILQFKKTLVGADPRNIEPLYHRMIGAASKPIRNGFIGYRWDRDRTVGSAWKESWRTGLSTVRWQISGPYPALCRCRAREREHA